MPERSNHIEHDQFLRLLLSSEREIMRYIMSIVPASDDAREIFQETAVALWKQIDQYDSTLPFTPWANRFAANKAKEHLRKSGRWRGFLNEETATELLNRRTQLGAVLDRRVEPLQDCLAELPSDNRSLICKYYFEEESVEDIASDLNRTVAAVYKSLQRVRLALLKCVNGKVAALEASS